MKPSCITPRNPATSSRWAFMPMAAIYTVDAPKELFHTRPLPKTWNLYDVASDGQRFLMNVPMEWPSISEIKVTTSWVKELSQ